MIELILVMALLTIGVALTAPALAGFFRGRTLDNEARRLLALTRHAQARAVTEGFPMLVWIDPDERRYGVSIDTTFVDEDPSAREYLLSEDLEVEVDNSTAGRTRVSGTVVSPSLTGQRRSLSGLRVLRFLPDGYVSPASPRYVRLLEIERDESRDTDPDGGVWLIQTTNRLAYELRTQAPDLREF